MNTPNVPPPAPLHPTVLDALANTPIAPLLNQPVENVLAHMGLPALPQLPALPPLPGLPALPQINPTALFKPITDMFASFGTGQLGQNGAINPQTIFSDVTEALTTAISLGSAGLSLLSLMEGSGSQAASDSGTAASDNNDSLTTQSTQINSGVGAASTTVGVGASQMAETAGRFMATVAALGPALVTPIGQLALLGAGVSAGAHATAITAETKVQLAAHSAHMRQAGTPVSVTAAPSSAVSSATSAASSTASSSSSGSSSLTSDLSELMNVVQPLMTVAQTGISALTSQQRTAALANVGKPLSDVDAKFSPTSAGAGGGAGGGGVGESDTNTPLSGYSGENLGAAADAETATPLDATVSAAAEPMSPMAPMTPMGTGLAGIREAGDASGTSSHQVLVNAGHGNEVVGDIDTAAPAVVGGADWQSDSPDKALTL